MNKVEITVKKYISIRIDKYLSEELPEYSRNYIQNLFKEDNVLLNGKNIKPSTKVKEMDKIIINIPIERELKILPEDIDLDIIYEDKYLAIINKESNLSVHPTENNTSGTLVNALLNRFKNLSDIYSPLRPGIVHRLDKDTTGLLIIAKDNKTHELLSQMFKDRVVKKIYIAIVNGRIDEEIVIDKPIGRDVKDRKKMAINFQNGKNAITKIYPICYNTNYSFVKVEIETGRTHQIRVHLKSINHSIVGDKTYGIKNEKIKLEGQLLHAYGLEFSHPVTKKLMRFTVKPDEVFLNSIRKLDLSNNNFFEEYIF